VDGEARADEVAAVEHHITTCAACRSRVATERTVRTVLRARASALATTAPPGLRTRLLARMQEERTPVLGWRGRLTSFAAAAAVIVIVVSAFEWVTPRSNVLLAAQLAIDHVRCFVVEMTTTGPADHRALERQLHDDYGWSITVPASNGDAGVTLIAARRCPYWLGPYAHLLYRTKDSEVSLYVAPGRDRTDEQVEVLGHTERLWTVNGTSYALIARGLSPSELERVGAYLERETRAVAR
jgi:anti-sigma factor RsiW